MVGIISKARTTYGFAKKYIQFLTKQYSPIFANIDLTMKCNSRCRYCLRWKDDYELGSFKKNKDEEMTTEQAFAVIDNLSKFPLLSVTFQGAESLTRKDTPEILAYAKKKGIYTILITNAILLEKRIEEIAPYIDTLLISYDTPYENDYEYLRGVNALKIVERGIKKAVELSKIHKFLVITNSVLTNVNAKYLRDVVKRGFDYLGVHGMSFEEVLVPPGCSWGNLKIESKESIDYVINTLKELKKKYPIMNSTYYLNYLNKKVNYTCKPWLFLMVNTNGTVNLPCVVIPNKVIDFTQPNAHKQWYADKRIWNIKCNTCTMQCVVEISKLFPCPPPDLFYEWTTNFYRAKARMESAASS